MNEYTGPVGAAKVADAPPVPEANAEAYPEAAALLCDAGWSPHPEWGVYTRGTLVMALQPDGQTFHVKDWAMIQPGHPKYGPDTPDTAEEAAAWLVARFPKPEAEPNVLAFDATLELGAEILAAEAEAGESLGDGHEERSDELGSDGVHLPVRRAAGLGDDDAGPAEGVVEDGGGDHGEERAKPDLIDADFSEPDLPAIEGQDVAEEPAEAGGSQFIFGDNLDQMRTAAIGLVMRHARALTPSWAIEDDAALIELRNFTMGVSEGRWPDDAGRRAELDTLEGTLAHINAIARARDEKVEFLEGASREDIQAFDPEAGWP